MNNKGFLKGMITGAALVILLCGIVAGGLKVLDVIRYGAGTANFSVDNNAVFNKVRVIENIIDNNGYYDIKSSDLEDGIYKGLVAGLNDDYATYLTPQENGLQSETNSGEYRGIGVTMSTKGGNGVEIQSVYEGTPAARAGIRSKDIITEADGEDYIDKTSAALSTYIRTSDKDSVALTVYRPSTKEFIKMDVALEKIVVPAVTGEINAEGIGYIQIRNFHQLTEQQFKEKYEELRSRSMKGVILDLRGNPGGLVNTTLKMLDYLLPECDTLIMEDREKNRQTYRSEEGGVLDIPCVVLINGSSASAAEIFTGAMQDNGYAVVVGSTSYGKGIVQGTYPVGDGSAVKLTIAKYYTPGGHDIHKNGIKPDVEVENSDEKDDQLDKAMEVIKSKIQ